MLLFHTFRIWIPLKAPQRCCWNKVLPNSACAGVKFSPWTVLVFIYVKKLIISSSRQHWFLIRWLEPVKRWMDSSSNVLARSWMKALQVIWALLTSWESGRGVLRSWIFSTELQTIYSKQSVLSFVIEFILFPTFWVHKQVKQRDPNLSFSFGQLSIFWFWNQVPTIVFEYLSFSFLGSPKPGPLFNKRD